MLQIVADVDIAASVNVCFQLLQKSLKSKRGNFRRQEISDVKR